MTTDPGDLARLPAAPPWTRIGLFGGSFDPPHAGHVTISAAALRRLELDQLWWIVSPGNPLKGEPSGSFAKRIEAARAMIRDPRIVVTGLEARIGHYTVDTIRFLVRRFPRTRFVWIMGADNLIAFHRWRGWREIAASVPIAVFDRPRASLLATASPAARALNRFRLPENTARMLAEAEPPAWMLLHGPRLAISSTALRRNAGVTVLKP